MRTCYQCHKEIPDVEGKYFCSRECWDKYGSTYKPLKGSKRSIEEIQKKLREFKSPKSSLLDQAKEEFGVKD